MKINFNCYRAYFQQGIVFILYAFYPLVLANSLFSITLAHPGEIDIAFHIMDRWKFSFNGSLIISAALHANCAILFTEDLQHGQKVQNLKITNPFRKI